MSDWREPGTPSDERIAGIVSPYAWDESELDFSFPDDASQYGSGYYFSAALPDFSPLTNAQKEAVRAALDADAVPGAARGFTIEGFTDLRIDSGSAQSAELRFGNTSSSVKSTATAYYPTSLSVGGDAWFGGTGRDPEAGNSDYKTILHETGHALGLKHAHESKGDRPPVPDEYDGFEYTLMTYRSEVGGALSNRSETGGAPQSYMMLDIAAFQYLYGADYSTNSGATTYSWKPGTGKTLVDGKAAIAPGENRIFATIWDGGGKDTYDLNAYETGVQVNLTPGASSLFSEGQAVILDDREGDRAAGNIYNALLYRDNEASLIENALGGSGDDRLVGNDKGNKLKGNKGDDRLVGAKGVDKLFGGAGEDKLEGGKGSDKLSGGKGDDTFIFRNISESSGKSVDKIVKSGGVKAFSGAGKEGGDRVNLSDIDANETKRGDQSFDFGNKKKSYLSEAGHLWAKEQDGNTLIQGTVDDNKGYDFEIVIKDGGGTDASDYAAVDFIL